MTGSVCTENRLKATQHFLCWKNPKTNNSNNNNKITSSFFLSECASKQNGPSSCLLYVLPIEITCQGTRHKGCSCKPSASQMTFFGTCRREIDLKLPRCSVCFAATTVNLPGVLHSWLPGSRKLKSNANDISCSTSPGTRAGEVRTGVKQWLGGVWVIWWLPMSQTLHSP